MTAAVRIEELPSGLDWEAFSTRCFPGSRRHDLEAVAAYGAYKRLRQELDEGGVTSNAVDVWEDEGGATSEEQPGGLDRTQQVAGSSPASSEGEGGPVQ